jgi:hypothetical protein
MTQRDYSLGDLSEGQKIGVPAAGEAGGVSGMDSTLQTVQGILDSINQIINHPLVAPLLARRFPQLKKLLTGGENTPAAGDQSNPMGNLDASAIARAGIAALLDYLIKQGMGERTVGDVVTELSPLTVSQVRGIFT